jgi:hypothetical protein
VRGSSAFAGAAVGLVAPAFSKLAQDLLGEFAGIDRAASDQQGSRHDYRDCGAAKIAYAEKAVANPTIEIQTH